MSWLVSRQHRRKSSLSLSRPERIQRRSKRRRLAIVASADSGERRRREKRTRRVLTG